MVLDKSLSALLWGIRIRPKDSPLDPRTETGTALSTEFPCLTSIIYYTTAPTQAHTAWALWVPWHLSSNEAGVSPLTIS